MKVTLVNTHDIIGGAERCSYDIASHFYEQGDDVCLIVGKKFGSDSFVKQIRYRFVDYAFRYFAFFKLGLTDTTIASPVFNCFRWSELKNADVYNIHNMHGAYWNFWTLPILAQRAPIILTLHDEWFITGDCAYTYDCKRWLRNCGNCPQASLSRFEDRYAIGGKDLTRINLFIKRISTWGVPASKMAIITPSRWLFQQARKAPHLRKYNFHYIANGIDLGVYRPMDRIESQKEFGLPMDKLLIFTAAVNFNDRRKNFNIVYTLLRSNDWPKNTMLVCAGRFKEEERKRLEGLPVITLGYIDSRAKMAKALSACDFSLLLSKADNLPYTGLESLACGCPIIGSDIGGIPEIVDDGKTGWLVPAECTPEDLARILRVARQISATRQTEMRQQAREKAERCYGMDRFVEKYRKLFQDSINRCE